jgi:DNA-binding transcriptional ArsR family regulator
MKENPNYYAVIPARVLFDKNICAEAKILYGQIASLCNKEGYCWAGNAYFADLHGVSDRTVQRWLMSLKDSGYVTVEFSLVDGTREIETRKIRIADAVQPKIAPATPKPQPCPPPPDPPANPAAEVVTILSPPGDIPVG